jgi:hypothetical protein
MEIGRTEPRNGKWRWYSTPGLTGQKKKKKKKDESPHQGELLKAVAQGEILQMDMFYHE